jgi:MFS family permease
VSDAPTTLWHHAGFLRLWAAQTVSSFGARITREGLALASVLTIDAQPLQLGILAALTTGPGIVVGLFAGGFIDRSRKRTIMIGADLVRAAVLMTVPIAAWLHLLGMPQLYIVGAAVGGTSLLFDIADHAFLPHLIARQDLVEGNTKLSMSESLAEMGSPALAGILIQTLTAPFAIALNAATYLISALFLGGIAAHEVPAERPEKRPTLLADLKTGYDVMRASPYLPPLFAMAMLQPLFGGSFSALWTIYVIKTLGLTPILMGLTISAGGVGSVIGTALSPWLVRRFSIGPAIVLGMAVSGVSAILVPLAAGPLWLKLTALMAAQLIGDSMAVAALIPAASLRQSIIPRDKLGRTAALFSIGAGVVAVTGTLIGGALGGWIGVRATLYIAAAGIFLTPLIVILSPLRSLHHIPAAMD